MMACLQELLGTLKTPEGLPPLKETFPYVMGPLALGSSVAGFSNDFWRFTHDWGMTSFQYPLPSLTTCPWRDLVVNSAALPHPTRCTHPGFSFEDLAFLGNRVFVWQGDRDKNVPESHGRALAKNLPQAQYKLVPGGTHFLPYQHLEEMLTQLMEGAK